MNDEEFEQLKTDLKLKLANRVLSPEQGTELGLWLTGQAFKVAWDRAIAEGSSD